MAGGSGEGPQPMSRKTLLPLELLLLISGGVGLAVTSPEATVWMLGVWVALALGYVVIAAHRLSQAVRSPRWNELLFPGGTDGRGVWVGKFHADITVIGLASAMGLVSAFAVSLGTVDGAYDQIARFLAPAGIVLAWTLLQLGFCRLYANTWAQEDGGGGVSFPGIETPGLIEFTYLAFSVGCALQHPEVTTPRMRLLLTAHMVISFLYGTILIGFVVSLLPSN